MKTIRIMAAAAAALLLAGACTHETQMTTAKVEDGGSAPLFKDQEESPCMAYSYDFEYVTGGVSDALKDKINGTIVRYFITGNEELQTSDVPAACKAWEERTISSYYADNEEYLEDYDPENSWMYNWESTISGGFSTRCDARNWQTYMGGGSDYLGGAHPYSYGGYVVFDMSTGEEVKEADFLDVENSDLYDLLFAKVLEAMDTEEPEDLLDAPTFNANFSVDNEGVTWLFNPYEVAAYAYGPIEATLTWEELEPYLLKK